MAKGLLRVPIRLADVYVKKGEEARFFPSATCYLTLDEVLDVFPNGCATTELFTYNGLLWRLVKRAYGNGSVYLAILDEEQGNGHLPANRLSSPSMSNIDSQSRELLRSASYCAGEVLAHSPAAPGSLTAINGPSSGNGNGMALAFPSTHQGADASAKVMIAYPPTKLSLPQVREMERQKLMEGLIMANESPMPLDRYKALIRLIGVLRRQQSALQPTNVDPLSPETWADHDVQAFARDVVMVGESLAKFGTADFQERSNSSRAITSGDYATLLRCFLEQHGGMFQPGVLEAMPDRLCDDATAVCLLLRTRCEANKLIFQQLVRSVGLEPASGSALVVNNSNVNLSPTNVLTASPASVAFNAVSAAASAIQSRASSLPRWALIAAVPIVLILGRKLLFGRGGGKRNSGYATDSGYRSKPHRSDNLSSRLLSDKTITERAALRHVAACSAEMSRAKRNAEVLASEWRLGPVRLGLPLGSAQPESVEKVDIDRCSLDTFLSNLDGASAPHRYDL